MSLLKDFMNYIFPAECHVCECHLAPHEKYVCTHCRSRLPRSGYHRADLNPMSERMAGQVKFSRATGHFLYSKGSSFATLIHDMKYNNFPKIGDALGELVASELYSTGFFDGVDIIVPVPMHYFKQAVRGYNQTMHIAEGLGRGASIPACDALKAIRPHQTQTAMSREKRLTNTEGLFALKDSEMVKGKHVLLIDDVCTTGSTLVSAAKALWEADPSEVSMLTLGVTF